MHPVVRSDWSVESDPRGYRDLSWRGFNWTSDQARDCERAGTMLRRSVFGRIQFPGCYLIVERFKPAPDSRPSVGFEEGRNVLDHDYVGSVRGCQADNLQRERIALVERVTPTERRKPLAWRPGYEDLAFGEDVEFRNRAACPNRRDVTIV